MWIFTKDGFYSAVEDRRDSGRVVVRTRSKDDVIRLAKILKVRAFRSSETADYPYRLYCSKTEWASYVTDVAEEIDYDNFKGAMEKRFNVDRMDQLHSVWEVMAGWWQQSYKTEEVQYEDEEDYSIAAVLRRMRR